MWSQGLGRWLEREGRERREVAMKEMVMAILERHIPDFDDHSVERDAELTVQAIMADLYAAGWITPGAVESYHLETVQEASTLNFFKRRVWHGRAEPLSESDIARLVRTGTIDQEV